MSQSTMPKTISWTAPMSCSNAVGVLTVHSVGSNITTVINDLNLTVVTNDGATSTSSNILVGTHSITITANCTNFPNIIINGTTYGSPGNNHTYTVVTTVNQPDISVTVTCV